MFFFVCVAMYFSLYTARTCWPKSCPSVALTVAVRGEWGILYGFKSFTIQVSYFVGPMVLITYYLDVKQ